jgi:5-(carboxyamino)imidazole ribonucleotide synthase
MAAIEHIGLPAVLKTAAFGYDGKGQATVSTAEEARTAIADSPDVERIYESLVEFEQEISIVAARGLDGSFEHFPVVENTHRNHILDLTVAPAAVPPEIAKEAAHITRGIMESLDVVGVLCVEFFLTNTGKLLVNELAPRPHNSGHWTIDACITDQFEQQVRAVCGLPLGSPTQRTPAAMVNLLGDLWTWGEPNWPAALRVPGVKLHLYGKSEPRPGRKMGHLTALAPNTAEATKRALAARDALLRK